MEKAVGHFEKLEFSFKMACEFIYIKYYHVSKIVDRQQLFVLKGYKNLYFVKLCKGNSKFFYIAFFYNSADNMDIFPYERLKIILR